MDRLEPPESKQEMVKKGCLEWSSFIGAKRVGRNLRILILALSLTSIAKSGKVRHHTQMPQFPPNHGENVHLPHRKSSAIKIKCIILHKRRTTSNSCLWWMDIYPSVSHGRFLCLSEIPMWILSVKWILFLLCKKEKNPIVLRQILILEQLTAILRSQLIEHCYVDPVTQGPSFPQVKWAVLDTTGRLLVTKRKIWVQIIP